MRLLAPLAPAGTPLTNRNPSVKLGAAALVSLAAFAPTGPLTPALLVLSLLVAAVAAGVRPGALWVRCRLALYAAATVGLANLAFAEVPPGSPVLLSLWDWPLTGAALTIGVTLALRVLTLAVAGLLFSATTDPTDLADSLMRQLRVPARFAVGALAAYRLLPVLVEEWELLTLARRARGIDAGWSPVARIGLFLSTVFALLVGAVRRAERLATAMDARGFAAADARGRSSARTQLVGRADLGLLAGTGLVCAVTVLAGWALG